MSDYNYELPDNRIAKFPLAQRDASKLLITGSRGIEFDSFSSIGSYLPENGLLVFNNSKVIHARLLFRKPTGAAIEIFCLEPALPADYQQSFAAEGTCIWHCLVGNKKKWKGGGLSKVCHVSGVTFQLSAFLVSDTGDDLQIQFIWDTSVSFAEILAAEGNIPLPPYLNRKAEASDAIRYQTVYSQHDGSVAAPTAGLHFTGELLENLRSKQHINTEAITLHVGAGTFKPVSVDNPEQHTMHREHYLIPLTSIEAIDRYFGNITITGTTSLRAVESMYWLAQRLYKGEHVLETTQWEPYHETPVLNPREALAFLADYCRKNNLNCLQASTSVMIVPGYEFRYANRLITNFHQPRSTLLLLVAAFIGEQWKNIYATAIENDFRFLSYGDSMLLVR